VQMPPIMQVPVNEPVITDTAIRYVTEAMASGWISSAGPVVESFERRWAAYLGAKHAVATNSGTTALHLALVALGIGRGDEVIVPDFTMIAPVAAIFYTGATPVFVDCDPHTYTIDPALIAAAVTPRTRAILPVHIYGHSADMDPILAIAAARRLHVIEDAAEAHGSTYKGALCGTLGDVGCFSFYGNKIVTTGEGGMLVTDDDGLAALARHLKDMAHDPAQRFRHDRLGFSYRLSSLAAAFGLGQLEHIEAFLERKRWMAACYARRLAGIAGLRLPVTRPWAGNAYWMYAVCVEYPFPLSRDALRSELRRRGIDTRASFLSSSSQPMVCDRIGMQGPSPVSEGIAARGLYLPSGLALTQQQIDYVCDAIVEIAR
jgi:perosamine synthetase